MLTALTVCALLAASPDADHTQSPYFFVEGGDPAVDRLPLEDTSVDVKIAGVIADVTVRQRYRNEGERPLNTRYVFPGSTRAAVHGLMLKVGDHAVRARIRERDQAKAEFEQAKAEGKTASLLSEERPNVFTMQLSNVMPKDVIEVELHYSELLVPEAGIYELVYPTVVGPRYESAEGEHFAQGPVLHEGKPPPSPLHVHVTLTAGLDVHELASPSHAIDLRWHQPATAEISLKDAATAGNRDFILHYRLAGGAIGTGLLLSEPTGDPSERFFLLQLQPPQRVATEMIPAREYIFVVDVSGSMHGFPLDTAKTLMHSLIGTLRPTDRFNILFFSGGSELLSPESLPATPENLSRGLKMMSTFNGGGGTELLPALHRALELPRQSGVSRSMIVITDGYVQIEREAFELVDSKLGEANLFAFGIGSSVNRYLIEGLAAAGHGTPFIVTESGESDGVAKKLEQYVRSPVLTGITASFDGFEVSDVEPKAIPDVLADRPIILRGKWSGRPKGRITVRGTTGSGPWSKTFQVAEAVPSHNNDVLRYLWARERVQRISDFALGGNGPDDREQVTALGLQYELLTKYTSFIAVLEQIRNTTGKAAEVEQPQPLPQGVSEAAVGVENGDEPGFVIVLAVAMGLAAFVLRRRGHTAAS
jgi:Ca-activated chloride channel family protein